MSWPRGEPTVLRLSQAKALYPVKVNIYHALYLRIELYRLQTDQIKVRVLHNKTLLGPINRPLLQHLHVYERHV